MSFGMSGMAAAQRPGSNSLGLFLVQSFPSPQCTFHRRSSRPMWSLRWRFRFNPQLPTGAFCRLSG